MYAVAGRRSKGHLSEWGKRIEGRERRVSKKGAEEGGRANSYSAL